MAVKFGARLVEGTYRRVSWRFPLDCLRKISSGIWPSSVSCVIASSKSRSLCSGSRHLYRLRQGLLRGEILPDGFAEGGDDTLIMGDTEVLGLLTAGDENRVETGARTNNTALTRCDMTIYAAETADHDI